MKSLLTRFQAVVNCLLWALRTERGPKGSLLSSLPSHLSRLGIGI